jgi:hypothetical protein
LSVKELEDAMRAFKISNLVLVVVFPACALISAQQPRQENHPSQPEEPRQTEPRRTEPRQAEPRPEPRQQQTLPSRQEKQEQKREKQSRDQMGPAQQDRREQAHARPAGRSAHIPDDRFRGQFGRAHTFVVRPSVVRPGQQGFVYGGYTFVFLDPWPADWAYTDDCYVDYVDDEYYLYDMMHPGMRVALFVVM